MFFLLCKRLLEVHLFLGNGMAEPELGGMEHQAVVAMRVAKTI